MKKIILLVSLLLLSGCQKKEVIYEDNSEDFVKLMVNNAEVYNDLSLFDAISMVNKDIEIVSDNYKINTNKLGNEEVKVYYLYDDKKYVYRGNIEIVDTTPPLVFSGTSKSVQVGYQEDLCNLITYGDNYTGDVKCTITGDYDLNTAGTYQLAYKLSDSSNNTKDVNVTLKVTNPPQNTGGSGGTSTSTPVKKTLFSDVYNGYKTPENEIGIDVSKWQGDIDFAKVKEAGASFVMLRLGSQGIKSRELSLDEYYEANIKKAKEAGLKVGVYLYSVATSVKEAKDQATWVLKNLKKEKLDLPIVFDWENWANWNSYKISFHEINEIADIFMKTVEDAGYQGMLYGSKFYLETIWTNKDNYPVWLAHYIKQTTYEKDYQIWQLCNDGKIDGINGDVDIDILYN